MPAFRTPSRAPTTLPAWAAAALALACEAVIGIEDITDQTRPGTPGAGGQAEPVGAAGDQNQAGSAGAGGAPSATAGAAGTAPSSMAGSGGAPDLPAGQAGTASVPDPEDLIDDPNEEPPDNPEPPIGTITVSGRVIDFFRRPVPGVPVSIGDQTDDTDSDGHFTITGVEPPYDAKLMLSMTRDNTPARYGYVYEALTREDPTLQVYSALIQRSSVALDLNIENVDFTDPDRRVAFSFASPDGRYADSVDSEQLLIPSTPEWTGPATINGQAHALSLLLPGGIAGQPPTAYEAYQSQPFTAANNNPAVLTLDLAPSSLPTTNITGSTDGGSLSDRSNYLSIRFADGTALPIIDQDNPPDDFDYLVPDLEDTRLVLAAADGTIAPYAVAWREGISPGEEDIDLTVPNPVLLSAPQNNGSVTPTTSFSWVAAGQTAQTFVWHLESTDSYSGILVVTPRTQIELPDFPDGFTVPLGERAYWSVETHGNAANTDELTGTEGFLDPFSVGNPYPVGLVTERLEGFYTESARNSFVMGE
jgi:hypothetical protein